MQMAFDSNSHSFVHAEARAAEHAEHHDARGLRGEACIAEVELAAAEHVDHLDLFRHVPGAGARGAAEDVDHSLDFVALDRRGGVDANAELGLLLGRVVLVGFQIEVVCELDELVGRFGIERFVEPAFEGFARQPAVAVIHDQLVDGLLAQLFDGSVLRIDGHAVNLVELR